MPKVNVAIVGATGVVGRTMLACLEERDFPVANFYPVASERSAGNLVKFKGKEYPLEALEHFDFSKVDIALFAAGGQRAKDYAPRAAELGCVVIDNSSAFRLIPEVPLVIPEVNGTTLEGFNRQQRRKMIIANPNCSTAQMLMALKPIYDAVGISRINVATYQSVSGSGKAAVDELKNQIREWGEQKPLKTNVYPVPIAFNVIPHIDVFEENGYTKEEMKMVYETQKILGDDTIQVNPTAVRVPVFYGHSEAVHIETREKISAHAVRELLEKAPGIEVMDGHEPGQYPTPALNGEGTNPVFVGRIREDISHPHGIDLWVVADNIRKGAALNAVQIAEYLLEYYWQ